MPRDSAAADRPASYLVGTAAAFPLFFRDRTKPINQLPFSPSAKFPKSGSSCESRVSVGLRFRLGQGLDRRPQLIYQRRAITDVSALLDPGQSVPQCQKPFAAERGGVQFLL